MAPNDAARANWNGESGQAWVADADRRDVVLAPMLDALLDAAAPRPGEHVLDVGCGCGATTLAVADQVGPTGRVLGIDISEPMLDVARRRADDAGVAHVDFTAADAQTHELPATFDLAISRFGTMFFDAPADAFATIAGAVRAGGRLCIVTWQSLAANEWLALTREVLLRFGEAPEADPAAPGMFAQADPAAVGDLLAGAGFTSVESRPVALRMPVGTDVRGATDYLTSVGLSRGILDPLDPETRQRAVAALTDALAPHVDASGVHLGAGILVTTATR